MAVVNSNSYEDDDEVTGSAQPNKNGNANVASAPVTESEAPAGAGNTSGISSGASGTSVNTATPGAPSGNANANASGSWTNLNDYLNANQGAPNNLGSRVLNTVNTAATQGTGIINSAGQNFTGDVNTGTDVYNPNLTKQAVASPTSFLQGPEYSQLVSQLAGTYSGPSDWGTSTEAANATSGEQNAEQTANLGLTSQGRQQILNQTSAQPYTQGEGNLNEFLLDNNPTQLQPITAAANIGGNLQGQYQQVAQNAGNEVTAGQNTSTATGAQSTGDILAGQTAFINNLTNQATAAQNANTTESQAVSSLLANNAPINDAPQTAQGNVETPPQLTSAEISSLGITPDQYNQLIALNQQALAAGAAGIKFGNYYTAPNSSLITPASQATTGQISDFNALNTFVPGSNQQFLSGATGTPTTPNGSFNYANAVNDLNSQISSAAQAAQQAAAVAPATGAASTGGSTAAQTASGIGGLASVAQLGGKVYNALNPAPPVGDTADNPSSADQTSGDGQGTGVDQPTAGLSDPSYLPGAAASAAASIIPSATLPNGIVTVDPNGILDSAVDTGATAAADAGASDAGDVLSEVQSPGLDSLGSDAASTGTSGAASTLGTIAGIAGTVYSLYNAVTGWQSGATASDAVNGAELGAAIGTDVDEFTFGLGTVVGAVIGGLVGAVSSIAGGGEADPETVNLQNYVSQYNNNPNIASSLTPSQNFQLLAGVFDGKDPTAGHSTSIEQIFGREGEGSFVSQMTNQINAAIKAGTIPPNASAAQIYSSVVDPWLGSMSGSYGGGQTTGQIESNWTDVNGNQFGNAIQAAVQNLIGSWINGNLTGSTPVGVTGQTMGSQLPTYAGVPPPQAAQQAAVPTLASAMAQASSNPSALTPTELGLLQQYGAQQAYMAGAQKFYGGG